MKPRRRMRMFARSRGLTSAQVERYPDRRIEPRELLATTTPAQTHRIQSAFDNRLQRNPRKNDAVVDRDPGAIKREQR